MKPVQIIARRRRHQCKDCGDTFLDELPTYHKDHDATERLVDYIGTHALQLTCTFTRLAQNLGISEKFVRTMFQTHIERLECEYAIQTPRYLGIDEIYIGFNKPLIGKCSLCVHAIRSKSFNERLHFS